MKSEQFLIDTEVLYKHLTHRDSGKNSFLTQLMMKGDCFTTVLNASELYFSAVTEEHKIAVKKLLYALKVLGLSSRYTLNITDYSQNFDNYLDCLFYIVAEKNNLSIATYSPEKFKIGKVKVVSH